jgi:2'-5' RNA ligase
VPRLFVAVYPPDEVIDALATLPHDDAPGVRWVPREQLHVTVRFFGEAAIDDAVRALESVAGSLAPADVELGPRVSRLGRNVVCVPATGLDAIAVAVRDATADLGEPVDPRPFRGHVTLARLRHRGACGLTGHAFRARFEADELHLVESVTRSAGAEHTRVRTWRLAGA